MSATPTIPVDVVNQALDEIGVPPIGALTDGTTPANAASRWYWVTLRAILSAAPWNFARMEIPLTLLGSKGAPVTAPTPPAVFGNPPPNPWVFMYEWPVDCVHFRYVPTGTDGPDQALNTRQWWGPAPFLIHSYPLPNTGDGWDDIEGHDPDSTRVILTNVCNAHGVYTALKQYPDAWDALFQIAFAKALAAALAMPCVGIKDVKAGMALRNDMRQAAVTALDAARVRDGDEGWTVTDHTPDWIRTRTSGPGAGWWGPSAWRGWNPMPWSEDAGGVY